MPIEINSSVDEITSKCSVSESSYVSSYTIDDLKIYVVKDINSIMGQWRKLQMEYATPFQSIEWTSAWLNAHESNLKQATTIIIGEDPQRKTHFILPFLRVKKLGMIKLKLAGTKHSSYGGGLFSYEFLYWVQPHDIERLFERLQLLLPKTDLISLYGIPSMIQNRHNPLLVLPYKSIISSSYQLALAGDWDTIYKQKFSAKTRSKHRNMERRLAAMGKLKFVVAKSQEKKHELLDILLLTKSTQLKQQGLPDAFSSEEAKVFYQNLIKCEQNGSSIKVLLSAVELDDRPIAISLDIIHMGVFYGLITTLVEGPFSRYSPGNYLLRRNVQRCCEQGLSLFDFGVGEGDYKRRWSETEIVRYSVVVPISAQGWVYMLIQNILINAKYKIKTTPVLMRMMLKLNQSIYLCRKKFGKTNMK